MKQEFSHHSGAALFVAFICLAVLGASFIFFSGNADAAFGDCPAGFVFDPRSGVGCKQADCASIPSAHYSYEGYCVCGSSGSINENPKDPNKECGYPSEHSACPGCLYACVHLDEECPASGADKNNGEGARETGGNSELPPTAPEKKIDSVPPGASSAGETVQPVEPDEIASASTSLSALADASIFAQPTCAEYCERLFGGKQEVELLEKSGAYPACRCVADYKDNLNRITKNVVLDGDMRTTITFDPATGDLKSRDVQSLEAERAAIRERLGYKYSEEEIDRLLKPENVDTWFSSRMENIETSTRLYSPYFWWQHIVALLDHGFGNDADFVDTYHYGRCGDSMLWLERQLSGELGFSSEPEKKHEAMLSITGEKYWNLINHTSMIVRPQGISNDEWGGIVKQLMEKSGSEDGLSESAIKAIDPRLLDAKVLDPYFRKTTTVKDFIKGWSVIRIS
jgi:hypothetical protein